MARILLKTVLFILLFLIIVAILILTPPVQRVISKKVVAYIENKIDTRVSVGRVFIGFPKKVVIENLYVEDRSKDTLINAGDLKVNIGLWKLIFDGAVDISSIELRNSTVKIKRELPDTSFNFQFIVDAFTPAKSNTDSSAGGSASIDIKRVRLSGVRVLYKDVITGNDVETWLDRLDSKIDKINPDSLEYDIPEINISGLRAKVYQSKPLVVPESETTDIQEAAEPVALKLGLSDIQLRDINIDYQNHVSALYSNINLGNSAVAIDDLDLANRVIDIRELSLGKTHAAIRIRKKQTADAIAKEVSQEVRARQATGWRFRVSSIRLDDNDVSFINDNEPAQRRGIDYAHLDVNDLTLHARDFVFSPDSIAGVITQASLAEQKGFRLESLEAGFLYSEKESHLKDLYLKTPGTELKRAAIIRYASPDELQNGLGNVVIDADIDRSRLLVSDLLFFAPVLASQPAFANPSTTWFINTRVTGRVRDLHIEELQLTGLRDTRVDMSGRLGGLPDMKNIAANLSINEIKSSQRDIRLFIPPGSLPKDITLPNLFVVKGRLSGNPGTLQTDLTVNSDLGHSTITGTFRGLDNPTRMSYDATVTTRGVDLGTVMQQKQTLGPVSMNMRVEGSGTDPKTASARFTARVESALVNQYHYRDLELSGSISNQRATAKASIIDPNIHLALDASADLSMKYPAVTVTAMIDSLKMQALNLSAGPAIFRGKIDGNFPVTDPDGPEGRLLITQALFVTGEQRLALDTVAINSGKNDTARFITLRSDVMNADLTGRYQLTEIGYVIQNSIQPYFALQRGPVHGVKPYDFHLNVYVINNPAIRSLMPQVERFDSVRLVSHFTNDRGWNADLRAPYFEFGPNKLRGLHVVAETEADSLRVNAILTQLTSGPDIEINNTSVNSLVSNNSIDFDLNIKDRAQQDKYNLSGIVTQSRPGTYTLHIRPQALLLNYDDWVISENNQLIFSGQTFSADNFRLSRAGQQLTIGRESQSLDAPVIADFASFRLATLTGLVQKDSTLVDGVISGRLTILDMRKNLEFTGDMTVNDLTIREDTVGNVHILVNNKVANTYHAQLTLSGRGNDISLAGDYRPLADNNPFDFNVDIRSLPMATLQALSGGSIRNASGDASGKFTLRGSLSSPRINGDLAFNQAGFTLSRLNSYFTIDRESIRINERGIRLDNFVIKDSSGNRMRIDGTAATTNFQDYDFDLALRTNNFHALNSTKKDNDLFWGQLHFSTNLTVKGTDKVPVIDGRLSINDNTNMTVVLPQQDPGIVEREGIVVFIDQDAPLNDSLFMGAYDSLNITEFKGMEISMTVMVNKEANFTLIVDEGNGDFINVKGEAMLSANVDQSGSIILSGTYELESGSYELSFNFLKRKFDIEKGSKITWEGEPTKATVDISAKYVADIPPLDLVKNQLSEDITTTQRNIYLQRLPFEILLKMEGELLKPQIKFDIVLPADKSYVVPGDVITNVRNRLDQLRQEEGEMNKQVFSVLLLNRFVAENPFASSSNYTSASTLARQSVSKLLTEQLNRLASDLVGGVDLNFDIQSSQDYTTGTRADRTDLNVGLSKRLLDDRLTVSVGSNFELEGPQHSNRQSNNVAGNIAIDYKLSRDGRYMIRAYRKNEYEGIIDGYIIETGVGFIITVDYNRFRQIFESRRKRREQRERQRRAEEAAIDQAITDDKKKTNNAQ